MKQLIYSILLFFISSTVALAQGNSYVDIYGSVGDCAEPTEVNETSVFNADIDFVFNQPGDGLGLVRVSHDWIICKDGAVVAEVSESAGTKLKTRNLNFIFQPGGDGGDFPSDLESGVYEIKLKTCYTKRNGMEQVVHTTGVSSGDNCSQQLIFDEEVCCNITVGCIDYTDCPDVSIAFNTSTGQIEATVPPGATAAGITATRVGETYQYGLTATPREGCWNYTVHAEYPNGCHDSASIRYCNVDIEIDDPFENPCQAPGMRFNPLTGLINVRVPSAASGVLITATSSTGLSCTISSTPFLPKIGCWIYTAVALYDNDCVNRTTLFHCAGGVALDDSDELSTRSLETQSGDNIKVYPTVFDETINIEFKNDNNQQLQIFNSTGKLVHSQSLRGVSKLDLDGQQFDTGLYIIKIVDNNNQVITKKIIRH